MVERPCCKAREVKVRFLQGGLFMPTQAQLPIYRACIANLREIERCKKKYVQFLNLQITLRDNRTVVTLSKQYSLIFSVWAEARLLATLYTPYGFKDTEIKSVLAETTAEGRWKRMINLALQKAPYQGCRHEEILSQLNGFIDDYVVKPAGLRNKFAHGQWETALNSGCDAINSEITTSISGFSPVQVDLWFEVFKRVSDLIEILVESPKKGFTRTWWGVVQEIDQVVKSRMAWTLSAKRNLLITKKNYKNVP